MFKRLFVNHPASVGETYFEHMAVAFGFGFKMLGGASACIIHGIVPCLFERTGSRAILRLHDELVAKRGCKSVPPAQAIATRTETALS
jgi:Family of unknown function (DUF6356)